MLPTNPDTLAPHFRRVVVGIIFIWSFGIGALAICQIAVIVVDASRGLSWKAALFSSGDQRNSFLLGMLYWLLISAILPILDFLAFRRNQCWVRLDDCVTIQKSGKVNERIPVSSVIRVSIKSLAVSMLYHDGRKRRIATLGWTHPSYARKWVELVCPKGSDAPS
jgi:hypothetical protein